MKRTEKAIEERSAKLEQDMHKHYEELFKGIREEQQKNYEDLIRFVNKLGLHELRRTELIMFIDRLLSSMGGIDE